MALLVAVSHPRVRTVIFVALAVFWAAMARPMAARASTITWVGSSEAATSTKSLPLTSSASTAPGDLLLVSVSTTNVAHTVTAPSGWTAIRTDSVTGLDAYTFWRRSPAAGAQGFTFTISANGSAEGSISTFHGARGTTPVDVSSGGGSTSVATAVAPAVTATHADDLLVGLFFAKDGTSFTPPAGMTERLDQSAPPTQEIATQQLTASGSTGTRTATATTKKAHIGELVALIPDETAPTASIASITAVTGTAYQYSSGSTVYVNPVFSGSFALTVAASDADSGVDHVSFPALGSGWTPSGGSDSTSPYQETYSWVVGDASPGAQSATAVDGAGNTASAAFSVTNDSAAPTGGSVSYPSTVTNSTTASIPFSVGTDAGAGVASWQLEREQATLSAGVCGAFGAYSPVGGGSPVSPYADTSLADGTCYRYELAVSDNVSNVTTYTSSSAVEADTTPPMGTISSTPAGPVGGSVTLTGLSADMGSGVENVRVTYDDGTGDTGNICLDPPVPTSWSCVWNTTLVPDAVYTITSQIIDDAGNLSTTTRTIAVDNTPPSGGSISYPGGPSNAASEAVTFSAGTDTGSGIASWQLERRSAAYAGGACSSYGSWANVGGANPASLWTDTSIVDGGCYQYELVATDGAGNQSTDTSSSALQVDYTAPTGTISSIPAGPVSGSATLTGTSADTESGIEGVWVSWAGPLPSPTSGNVCVDPAPATSWSCSWDTTSLPDGTYTVTSAITDNAGNYTTVTRTIMVDNNPPTASFDGFAAVTNPQYQYADGDTLWVNNSQSGAVEAAVSAVDAGSGIDEVLFPALGAGWTPAGGDGSGPSPYTFDYSWTAGAVSPGVVEATAYDGAGNESTVPFTIDADNGAPSGGSLSYPDGVDGSGSVALSFTSGSDSGSGIGSTQLQRASAPYAGGVCGVFGAFADLGPSSPVSPYTDTSIASGNCYEYQIMVTDNVDNAATVGSSSVVEVP